MEGFLEENSMTKKMDSLPTRNLSELRKDILETLIHMIEEEPPMGSQYKKQLRSMIKEAITINDGSLAKTDHQRLLEEIYQYVTSYEKIAPLLNDPQVSEIMINGHDQIYKEIQGEISLTDIEFDDENQVLFLIHHIINPLGRYINSKSPMIDAHLPDGSRVNAVIPPVVKQGAVISIRKFLKNIFSVQELLDLKALSENMADFVKVCVQARLNILVAGNTSSGKTTFLNILATHIPDNERIITIEDSLELQLNQSHILSLEARPPDNHGEGMVTIRDLVKNTLRMRPDRIIVGEVRGPEALDMLQAMNTGHDGSMTTIHSNSPRDSLSRLETMCLMAGLDMPVTAIRKQVASAIDLVVYLTRFPDGTRKVTQISEIVGMESEVIQMTDLFVFKQTGINDKGQPLGNFRSTGLRPMFERKITDIGLKLPPTIFQG
jgi:pilus assembly protein CpaF